MDEEKLEKFIQKDITLFKAKQEELARKNSYVYREGDLDRPIIPEASVESVHESTESAQEHGFVIGAKVRLKHRTSLEKEEIGEVIDHNKARESFYSGDRYPIRVKFERGEFEYAESDLELIK